MMLSPNKPPRWSWLYARPSRLEIVFFVIVFALVVWALMQ